MMLKKLLTKHYGTEWRNLENLSFYRNLLDDAGGETQIQDEENDVPMTDLNLRV